jgi:hypothetical protein
MPDLRFNALASHSVIQRGVAAPLTQARTQSGLYPDERGNRSARNVSPEDMKFLLIKHGSIGDVSIN